jgi:ribosome-associated translation inhibitor RaiA
MPRPIALDFAVGYACPTNGFGRFLWMTKSSAGAKQMANQAPDPSGFTVDYNIEIENLGEQQERKLKADTEQRLHKLLKGHTDLTGAAVALETLAQRTTQFIHRARVVVYARPENIAGVAEAETPEAALREALSAVERQVREKRARLRDRTRQANAAQGQHAMDEYELSTLTPAELFNTYVKGADPDDLVAQGRDHIAVRLMMEAGLKETAAFYAADQILVHAQDMIDAHSSIPPAEY